MLDSIYALHRLMQDEAQIDTDGAGDALEDAFDEITGGLESADAVFLYGIVAFGLAAGSMVLYFILPATFADYRGSLTDHAQTWFPVAWGWLVLGFWDNEATRATFSFLVLQSMNGPFKRYWEFLSELTVAYTTAGYWSSFWSYINVAIVFVYNLLSIMYQVFLIPKIYDWVENAPYYNEEYEGEDLIDQAEENTSTHVILS